MGARAAKGHRRARVRANQRTISLEDHDRRQQLKAQAPRLHNGDDQTDLQHHPMEAQDDHLQFAFDAANEVI